MKEEKYDGFEIIEHTSEVGFRAVGKNLEEAFENAGKATFQVMKSLEDFKADEALEFNIESEGLEALLYDWVEHLIYLCDTEQMIFKEFDVKIEGSDEKSYTLKAEIRGENLENIKAQDVKAVTYSDMKIEETKDGYMLQVILDV